LCLVCSEHVNVKGDMKYNTLLRIDGSLRGNIMAPPSAGVVIGPTGQLYGNILGIGTCLIEGKVVGNVNAESVAVTETGQVHGDISARSLDMKPSSILCGQLHIR
jgi:cytoskeletal protein CcmA (bactofilin family)